MPGLPYPLLCVLLGDVNYLGVLFGSQQLQRSADGFSVVADYFGRGVFSNKVSRWEWGGGCLPCCPLQSAAGGGAQK